MTVLKGEGAFANLPSEIEAFVPFRSSVLAVLGEGADKNIVRELSKFFLCKVVVSFKGEVEIEEGVKAVIGVGENRLSTRIAKKYALPLISIVLSPDCAEEFSSNPKVLACDYKYLSEDEKGIARAFGKICSLLCASFDRSVLEALGETEAVEKTKIADIVFRLLSEKKITARLLFSVMEEIFKSGNGELLRDSSAVGIAKALGKTELDNLLVSALISMRASVAFLRYMPVRSFSVPNQNDRLDALYTALGVSLFSVIPEQEYISKERLDRWIYCINERRYELLKSAVACEKTLNFAFYILKRLYKDKGFFYNKYLGEANFALGLALAPELTKNCGLLGVIKALGLSDRYLKNKWRRK